MKQQTIKAMREALEYYADEQNYRDMGGVMSIECDEGEVARKALKLIER